MENVRDVHGRPLRDLRISVTDRCSFRCPYCMPAEAFGRDYAFLPKAQILTFEEILRVARVATGLGVRKVRLTGGEPLLRREIDTLVRLLAAVPGLDDLALTTNGLILANWADKLQAAGLRRVTVSLDALDDKVFRQLSGADRPVAAVLEGILAALAAGLPVKVNCVVQRGSNEDEVLPLAAWCREHGCTLRLIEYMDVGNHNHWDRRMVVPAAELRERLDRAFGLVALDALQAGEVARRYGYADGRGEVGFIASITEPFCRDCNRARLTADGKMVTCLFATGGADLRGLLRGGGDDAALADFMAGVWLLRTDRYSEERSEASGLPRSKVEMSYIGG
jgi:cyclic pyranopterin phosphate synthase